MSERGIASHGREDEMEILLACLVPAANASLLLQALRAEVARGAGAAPSGETQGAADLPLAERELHRVRSQLALGEASRMLQHAINNPLTALLAEAQLLEIEALHDHQRLAASRMVELARRVAAVVKRIDMSPPPAAE